MLPIVIVWATASAPRLIAPVPEVIATAPFVAATLIPAAPATRAIPPPPPAVNERAVAELRPEARATPPDVDAISIEVADVPCKLLIAICSAAPPFASSKIEGAPLNVDSIIISAALTRLRVPVNVKVPPIVRLLTTVLPELSTVKAPAPTSIPKAPASIVRPPVVISTESATTLPDTALVAQLAELALIEERIQTAPVNSLSQI